MAHDTGYDERPADPAGRALYGIANVLAVFGGLLCVAMAVLVTVSVGGRYLFAAPLPGDYDLIGILGGCAVFAFLPWCQMRRGNVAVDFFTTRAGPRMRAALEAFGGALYFVIAALFAWRLVHGGIELRESGEVLAVVEFYRWWTVPFDIFCLIVLIGAILWTLAQDIRAIRRGGVPPKDREKTWKHDYE
ncbi:MAG: TRAP transporter small permease subunit [Alphaproteobacteria bacterium]|nr:TRAP transporter small permease subunit [Alphaproteobacteria bacterium]